MAIDVVVPVEGEVGVVPAEVYPLDPDGPEEGVGQLLLQGGILQGIEGGTDDLSELVVRVIEPHELPLVGEGLILPPLLYLVLHESLVLVSQVDLLNLRLDLLNAFGERVQVKQEVPTSTRNLWQIMSVDYRPMVFWTALMARSTLYWKGFPLILGQMVMQGWPIQALRVLLSNALASAAVSLLAVLLARVQYSSAPSAAVFMKMTLSYRLSLRPDHVHPSSSSTAWQDSLDMQAAQSATPRSQRMRQGHLLISASRVMQSSKQILNLMISVWNWMTSRVLYFPKSLSPPATPTMVGTSGTISTLKPLLLKCFSMDARAVLFPAQGPPVRAMRQMGFFLYLTNQWQMLSRLRVEGASRKILDMEGISGSMEEAILRSSLFWSRRYFRKAIQETPRRASETSYLCSAILSVTFPINISWCD